MNMRDVLTGWLVEPGTFFGEAFSTLARKGRGTRFAWFMASWSIPLLASANMATFLAKNAVAMIISRFIPGSLAPVVYQLIALLMTLVASTLYLLLPPARTLFDENGTPVRIRLRRLGMLNVIRNNLCFLPSMVVSFPLMLAARPHGWQAFQYGLYLTMMFWFSFTWTSWIIAGSFHALPFMVTGAYQGHGTLTPGRRAGWRVAGILLVLYLAGDLTLSLVFSYLMGMERLPLFFKIAYFLMHGN